MQNPVLENIDLLEILIISEFPIKNQLQEVFHRLYILFLNVLVQITAPSIGKLAIHINIHLCLKDKGLLSNVKKEG